MKRQQPARLIVVAVLLVVGSTVPAVTSHQTERLVFFGDSLSDSGNHFISFKEISLRPFEPIPDAPYAVGGLHFSNGPTWAEQLARALDTPNSGFPALLGSRAFTNYAVGRARARPEAPVFPDFDLAGQVDLFSGHFRGRAPEATYAIWIGANDVGDAVNALATDPTFGTSLQIIETALTAVSDGIQRLWGMGARRFLILNVPNLALTPAVRAAGPQAQGAATFLTQSYNGALAAALDQLGQLPGIHIVRLDTDTLLTAVVANPQSVGLTNAVDSCLTFGVVRSPFCRTPQDYLFWDGFHPTRAGHAVVAEAATHVLAE
jgi:phospholipase/lecithinase/hemolysin